LKEFKNKDNAPLVTSWELMERVYGKLALFVKVSAQWNVQHHLNKLLKEGKVTKMWPDCWQLND
jgi:hypothetical protein